MLPLLLLLACTQPGSSPGPAAEPGQVHHDFGSTDTDFWAAPHPSAHRLQADGTVGLTAFPNPDGTPMVADLLALLHGRATGFGTTSAVAFRLADGVDPASLPGLAETVLPEATAYIVDVDPSSPERGRLLPLTARYDADAGPFGDDHLLSLLPLQGVPLRPGTRYAAVLTTGLRSAEGSALPAWSGAARLATGQCPAGLSSRPCAEYRAALMALTTPVERVAGLAAFTTADPRAELAAWTAHARSQTPAPLADDLTLVESFDDYCVFEGTTSMPLYQSGTPPYLDGGGEILLADDGAPALDHWEDARVVVTLPRQAPPAAGFPLAVMVRTGGGGDRPLVDRGPRDATGQVLIPGTGMAMTFAQAGWAGLSVDGPHGGRRNISGGDEQFLIFNVGNPAAMRDNLRQSALELALLPALAEELTLPSCDGSSTTGFDLSALTILGHSMGATIAPLTLGVAPEYRAAILSGAGGSWIENIVYKQSPLEVRPLAEAMLGYGDRELHSHDPALQLLQWAGESADPPVWGADIQSAGTHVLTTQGIVDTYILPPMANATSLSLGLDLGGDALDASHPDLVDFLALEEVLPFVDGQSLVLPVQGNRDGVTRVVVQHLEDGVEDGHEVLFQLEAARAQVRVFLEGLAAGDVPTVP